MVLALPRMLHLRGFQLAAALALLAGGASQASAAPCVAGQPQQLCPDGPGPCEINVPCEITIAGTLDVDLGDRSLIVRKTLKILGTGGLSVTAGSILFEPSARIEAFDTGALTLVSRTGIELRDPSRILLNNADSAGVLSLDALDGSVTLAGGSLEAIGTDGVYGSGGTVLIYATGDIVVDGDGIDVHGGEEGFAGDIDLYADGAVTVAADLEAYGPDGGDVTMDATVGDIVIAPGTTIDVQARFAGEDGGGVDIDAGGSASIAGLVKGRASEERRDEGPSEFGGTGATFEVIAGGDIDVSAEVDLTGGPSGEGGEFDLDAGGNVTLSGTVRVPAKGDDYGSGSTSISIFAGGTMSISGVIDAFGGSSGGQPYLESIGDVTVTGTIDADGGISGGQIDLFGDGAVTIGSTARLFASTRDLQGALGGLGGGVTIEGCSVDILRNAEVSSKGPANDTQARNVVRARSQARIAGKLTAGWENQLVYRTSQSTIQLLPDHMVVPPPVYQGNPLLMCCGEECPATTTTTTSVPTTTTTTLPPSTTTTLPPTTTTTLLPPTTTTTLPPPPTTTTTLPPPTTTTSTSTTTTTSATAPTTTSTTSTVAPTTSTTGVTPTTVTSTTAPSIPASTVTTTTAEPPTTSTTIPEPGAECALEADPATAASCRIGVLSKTLGAAAPEVLGGRTSARRLNLLVGRANRFLHSAAGGANPKGNLRKARGQLRSFEKAVQRGLKRKRAAIEPELGGLLLALVKDAANDVVLTQASVR